MAVILCTGGTGFVGANVVRHYLNQGHQLHLITRPGSNLWRVADIQAHLAFYPIGLGDRQALQAVVREIKPDWIFHFAVYGAYSGQQELQKMIETNIVGTVNLLEICREQGFEIFINAGSSSEYGFKDHAPHEQTWLDPNSHYAWTKASATHYCRYTALKENIPVYTLRLYSIFGPYEEPTRLIPRLITLGLQGTYPPLVQPDTARDFVYVDDVASAYDMILQRRPEYGNVYNVASGCQTTLREIVSALRRLLHIVPEPTWGTMPNRIWDTNAWVGSADALFEDTGWKPRYDLEKGLEATIDWYKGNSSGINRIAY